MKDERNPGSLKRCACKLGPMLCGRRRKARPGHVREAATRALKDCAAFQYLRDAVALKRLTWRLGPGIDQK